MTLSFITKNITLKLFSLIVASLLFLFVNIESGTSADVDFRLEYHLPDDIIIVGDAPTQLHATLRGPWAAVRSYDIADLKPVIIDIKNAGPGSFRRTIDINEITPPGGMRVISIRPTEIELVLDRRVERQVAVQTDIVGKPDLGYEVAAIETTPEKVWVSGPAKKVETLDAIPTRVIDIEGRREDISVDIEIKPPLAPIRLKEKRVSVTIRIAEELTTRSFENLPVRVDGAPIGISAIPDKVTVKLKGPKNLVENIEPSTIIPYVDITQEINEGALVIDKMVSLQGNPEQTQWIGTAPKVQIIIGKNKNRIRKKKPSPRN
ncbi:MAG: hypothetical protein JW841_07450 [Deltaproteobacteria bacterium]|nr:hypothetical protein [Deltaproteobacteria bacterium]